MSDALRTVVIGLGVQGKKRKAVLGKRCIATVDPHVPQADYPSLESLSPESYDAAFLCTPDEEKMGLMQTLLGMKKHILIEKPVWINDEGIFSHLQALAKQQQVVCYTAYNHRFEPHFVTIQHYLREKRLGRAYHLRLFYGNGTARLVRQSSWRDTGSGVLRDLAPHLLDLLDFWWGESMRKRTFHPIFYSRFENRAFDHVAMASNDADLTIECEMTLLSWKNHFTLDLFAEKGSLHMRSLCKWGPTTLTIRKRILPSGYPEEESATLVQPDPTWKEEDRHFTSLCQKEPFSSLEKDGWIYRTISQLEKQMEKT